MGEGGNWADEDLHFTTEHNNRDSLVLPNLQHLAMQSGLPTLALATIHVLFAIPTPSVVIQSLDLTIQARTAEIQFWI